MTLTEIVSKIVDDEFGSSVESFWAGNSGRPNTVCNGLFTSDVKSRGTRFVMPDGLLLYDCGIKVVLEIENLGAPSPAYLVGKWATASLARYFIHERMDCVPIPFSREATLIQICNSATARGRSGLGQKPEVQWLNVADSIRSCAPIRGSNIAHYTLLSGDPAEFDSGAKRQTFVELIDTALSRSLESANQKK